MYSKYQTQPEHQTVQSSVLSTQIVEANDYEVKRECFDQNEQKYIQIQIFHVFPDTVRYPFM